MLPVVIDVQLGLTLLPANLLVAALVQRGRILPLRARVAVMLAAVARTRTLLLAWQSPHRQRPVVHVMRVISVQLQWI